MTSGMLKGGLVAAVAFAAITALPGFAQDKPTVGLITKTETNPFFVKMREGAQAKAKELGVEPASPPPASSTATMTARSRRSRT